MKKNKEYFKKHKWLFILSITVVVLTIVFVVLMKTVNDGFKYGIIALIPFWTAILDVLLIHNLEAYKNKLLLDLPIYLLELYNNGVISKEQYENPTDVEKNMFLKEYSKEIMTRKFAVWAVSLVGLYLFIMLIITL